MTPRLPALLLALTACTRSSPLVMASTTSFQDTGLADALKPALERAAGRRIAMIFVGSGEALAMLRRGDADLAVVHAPAAEERFMAEGWGLRRREVMANDFVIVGPAGDPAQVAQAASATDAVTRIARSGAAFVSRADRSGTNERELKLWKEAGIAPAGAWYGEAGVGQADTLRLADDRRAYALTDAATYAVVGPRLALRRLYGGGEALRNVYRVIEPKPRPGQEARAQAAGRVADALVGPEIQSAIARFGALDGGPSLFQPLAR